jgi:serine/threonine-protein kinase
VNCELPAWLGSIIEKLHARDPADRFQSAREVAEILGRCLAHVQQPNVVPLPKSLLDLSTKQQPRRRWPRVAVPIGVIGLICLIIVVVTSSIGDRSIEEVKGPPQRSASDLLRQENATPNWNDGGDELISALDYESEELERRAEQHWDDPGVVPEPTSGPSKLN